ncbi:PQQ-dependent sugar dehydrogenase [Sphingomicrobium astaxanthinifaciens]|uniref:PQQ-dependent sugar dehydrogenase n=1 Tax=Sphingomicrobium astaxanthinifaciens TaxID=1227949 RepID=UPI001FCB5276|nr:PQQ-dependent sugar dehydrogenase [Sphingomicrobium astaxanthinifaciens]MCJ7420702.1 PQQ-dependent sugar dehydrogenase [Sphingomicrobium astaxanthinifaciens]
MRLVTLILVLAATAGCNANGPDRAAGATDGATTAGSARSTDTPPLPRSAPVALADAPFTVEELGEFDEPWGAEFMPGTNLLFITGKKGEVWFKDVVTGRLGSIESGLPEVDYGGQGGMGDIAFGPNWAAPMGQGGDLYLSWVEAGEGNSRGAVVGKGKLLCQSADACRLTGLEVLWRQDKTEGRGHYSHRIHFSPDGRYMFVTSGDRQEQDPAQDNSNNLGTVLRLNLDGSAAEGNPFYDQGGSTAEIWSYGHRNLLGLDFAPDGRLWEIEMGPKHGDELNLVTAGANYGWPEASYGDNYNGVPIPDHTPDDPYVKPAAYWVPATSPASLLIYSGELFADWRDDALVPGLSGQELNVVALEGARARAMTSYDFGVRLREVVEGPDGAVYLLEDDRGESDGTLLRLTPKR